MSTIQYADLDALRKKQTVFLPLGEKIYETVNEEVIRKVIDVLNERETNLVNSVYDGKLPQTAVEDKLDEILAAGYVKTSIPQKQLKKLVLDELFGYGFLQPILEEEGVTDLFVNNPRQILKRVNGKDYPVPLNFKDAADLEGYIRKICTRLNAPFNEFNPIVDTRDPKLKLRINGSGRPLVKEPYFTIRNHNVETFDIEKLIETGCMSQEMAKSLELYVKSWTNILVSGPTGSGKTTVMRCLIDAFIDPLERTVVLEEEEELQITHENTVSMETKKKLGEDGVAIEMDRLVKNAMRMSPRRIVLGELRHKEALELVRAFGTGHDGGLTSIHANDVLSALKQLAFLMLYAGTPLRYEHLLSMIADSVDIVVHVVRHKIVEIAEVTGYDPVKQEITTSPIWLWDVDPLTDEGHFEKREESLKLMKKMALRRSLRK